MPRRTPQMIRISLCDRQPMVAPRGQMQLLSQVALPQVATVCPAALHSWGFHPRSCVFSRQPKVLGVYSLSKVLSPVMMEPHGAKEARCMFLQAAEIMVSITFSNWVSSIYSFDIERCFIAGAPQVTTTSSGAFVASFMTDEDTSLHNW